MEWSILKPLKFWGDFGSVLAGGFYDQSNDGSLRLRRAGPFLPPISFPWGAQGQRVVVSDEFRVSLEKSGIDGLQFREAVKTRIVALDWHTWDRSIDRPKRYPPEGEPGGYLEDQPHSKSAALQMPKAWELLAPIIPVKYEDNPELKHELVPPLRAILPSEDFPRWWCSRSEFGQHLLSPEVRLWMEQAAKDWVRFDILKWRPA